MLGDVFEEDVFFDKWECEKGRVPNTGPGPLFVSASQLFDAGTADIIPLSTKST